MRKFIFINVVLLMLFFVLLSAYFFQQGDVVQGNVPQEVYCGVNYYPKNGYWGTIDGWSPVLEQQIRSDMQLMNDMNISLVRIFLPTTPSARRLDAFESYLRILGEYSIKAMPTFYDENDKVDTCTIRESGVLQRMKDSATAYIDRVVGDPSLAAVVELWDVKNEPTCLKFNNGTTPTHLDLFIELIEHVKTQDPNSKVTVGLNDPDLLDDLVDHVDVLQIHEYWYPDVTIGTATLARNIANSKGKEWMLGEFGKPSGGEVSPNPPSAGYTITVDDQTSYYEDVMPGLVALDPDYLLPWHFNDCANCGGYPGATNFEYFWGLIDGRHSPHTKKPAADIFSQYCGEVIPDEIDFPYEIQEGYLHPGIDIKPQRAVASSPYVYSTHAGFVTYAGPAPATVKEKGWMVQIESDLNRDNVPDVITRYTHMTPYSLRINDVWYRRFAFTPEYFASLLSEPDGIEKLPFGYGPYVARNQIIGLIGDSGSPGRRHIQYEIITNRHRSIYGLGLDTDVPYACVDDPYVNVCSADASRPGFFFPDNNLKPERVRGPVYVNAGFVTPPPALTPIVIASPTPTPIPPPPTPGPGGGGGGNCNAGCATCYPMNYSYSCGGGCVTNTDPNAYWGDVRIEIKNTDTGSAASAAGPSNIAPGGSLCVGGVGPGNYHFHVTSNAADCQTQGGIGPITFSCP